ncbi:MAG: hypothetical protein AAFQ39_00265 [Pseudomonadota bacterium]
MIALTTGALAAKGIDSEALRDISGQAGSSPGDDIRVFTAQSPAARM